MQFSIVIPCYNASLWLEQALNSALDQTYPATEIFVVDDGSTDDSRQIAQQIAARTTIPIHLLQSDRLGPAGARNVGIGAAIGDWIAFLDADDWWKPEHLQRIYDAVNGTNDVVYLDAAEHFSINANRVVSKSSIPFDQVRSGIDHTTYLDLYHSHRIFEFSGCAIQRDRLIAIGSLNPEFNGAEDLEVVLRALHNHTLTYDPVPSHYYRCGNPNSHSKKLYVCGRNLTATFRAWQALAPHYNLPHERLAEKARTVASKSIETCTPQACWEVLNTVWPYLSKSQKIIFSMGAKAPPLYQVLNGMRNRFRYSQYPPRKKVNA